MPVQLPRLPFPANGGPAAARSNAKGWLRVDAEVPVLVPHKPPLPAAHSTVAASVATPPAKRCRGQPRCPSRATGSPAPRGRNESQKTSLRSPWRCSHSERACARDTHTHTPLGPRSSSYGFRTSHASRMRALRARSSYNTMTSTCLTCAPLVALRFTAASAHMPDALSNTCWSNFMAEFRPLSCSGVRLEDRTRSNHRRQAAMHSWPWRQSGRPPSPRRQAVDTASTPRSCEPPHR